MNPGLNRETITLALRRLSELLRERGVQGEICLFGGTAMVLAFNARERTKDVDAVFHPPQLVRELAIVVKDELSLPAEWLNDAVKGFLAADLKPVRESAGDGAACGVSSRHEVHGRAHCFGHGFRWGRGRYPLSRPALGTRLRGGGSGDRFRVLPEKPGAAAHAVFTRGDL
jgi:hypothetical protein